jgi:hypothetical protein
MKANSDQITIAYGSKMFCFQDGENWCTRTGGEIKCILRSEGKSHVTRVFCGHKVKISKTVLQTQLFQIF